MKFVVEFTINTSEREMGFNSAAMGRLSADSRVKFSGTKISIGSGSDFSLIDAKVG